MTTVKDILCVLSEWTPLETAMEKDTVGLLAGREAVPVTKILVVLDITGPVIEEAVQKGCELIVSHHPVYRKTVPIRITDVDESGGALVLALCENRIAAICMHTNLDAAAGGVNDMLADVLGLENARSVLEPETGIGRCGLLPEPRALSDFAQDCKARLGTSGVRYYDAGRPAHRVAVCGGSGGKDLPEARRLNCDTLVTADVRHHDFLAAAEMGINLLDCGHFATENVVIPAIFDRLRLRMPELTLFQSGTHKEPYQCL